MPRYTLTLAYDGTAYAGWQVQPNALTIQAHVERALQQITGEAAKVHGSGRTDRGVHARSQVAHVDLATTVVPAVLRRGLNAVLPPDIRVLRLNRVTSDFHARRSAASKEYRYRIWNAEVLPPFHIRTHTHVRQPLTIEAMRAAAVLLEGRHDFAAFTANPNREIESSVRTLSELSVWRKGHAVEIRARADGFLYKMVRSLAGFLIRVGEGAVAPERVPAILASRTRTAHVPTAPPQGLILWSVSYG